MGYKLPEPVNPPAGGYNDFSPPPRVEVKSIDHYAARIKRGDNAPGAAWRLCTISQPRSLQELIAHVWTSKTPAPKDISVALFNAYSDWVDAGKPAAARR